MMDSAVAIPSCRDWTSPFSQGVAHYLGEDQVGRSAISSPTLRLHMHRSRCDTLHWTGLTGTRRRTVHTDVVRTSVPAAQSHTRNCRTFDVDAGHKFRSLGTHHLSPLGRRLAGRPVGVHRGDSSRPGAQAPHRRRAGQRPGRPRSILRRHTPIHVNNVWLEGYDNGVKSSGAV
ncbi:hypothetical protein L227DRAFT_400264 [Lentinus tigrinus ALCF2SS1-6]|uniref:Uncharacterized protein n=1 Tax=Lentinus tigrinus ALCF2SS1-6 TaxID=1328759 RepID=A0A5C2RQD1_9APHY|nr:hypothetical protein L227DRAFT_400264 [Lentinus tigrinus ALCF2SS1-6]